MDFASDSDDSFRAALGTAAGYALVLAAVTVVLFGLPLVLFSL